MLYVVPIEPLEERYSAQWFKWTKQYLNLERIPHKFVKPEGMVSYKKIKNGAFLDVVKTNVYKSLQMAIIMGLFEKDEVKDGDIFWFHDLWFPGLEMLFYVRDALKINFKIYGCLHAGTYDPNDYLTKKGMERWGLPIEYAWFNEVDGIFVATEYHKRLLTRERMKDTIKVHITGFPFYNYDLLPPREVRSWVDRHIDKKNVTVVFPHRLDEEKQPHLFDKLERNLKQDRMCRNWRFIKTKEFCKTKAEYYELLSRADIAVSFALQETWGIAMQEALVLGAIPVVPERLSYKEMYESNSMSVFFDGTVESAAQRIRDIVNFPDTYFLPCGLLFHRIIKKGYEALPNMARIMGVPQ